MIIVIATNGPANAGSAHQVQSAIEALQEYAARLKVEHLEVSTLGRRLLDQARSIVPQWLPLDERGAGSLWTGRADPQNPRMQYLDRVTVCLNTGSWVAASGTGGGSLISLWSYLRGDISLGLAASELLRSVEGCPPAALPHADLCPSWHAYVYDWNELRSLDPSAGRRAAPQSGPAQPEPGADPGPSGPPA